VQATDELVSSDHQLTAPMCLQGKGRGGATKESVESAKKSHRSNEESESKTDDSRDVWENGIAGVSQDKKKLVPTFVNG
jgi:hypothetical protein